MADKMRRYFIKTWILALLLGASHTSFAQSKSGTFSVELDGGYTYRSFDGIQGADFSALQHGGVDLSLKYGRGDLVYVLGYFYTPQIKLKDVRWTDTTTGDYTLDFSTPYIGLGSNSKQYIFEFLVGMESLRWSGTPEVGYQDTASTVIGVKLGKKWTTTKYRKLSFPFYGRLWMRPEKDLKFEQKPVDNSKVTAGTGFDLMIGVAYELF